jgi:Tol biopolymer transport system component
MSPEGRHAVQRMSLYPLLLLLFILCLIFSPGCARLRDDALKRAVEKGDPRTVEKMLARGADPNLLYGEGDSLLLRAAQKGDGGIAELLIESGADIDYRDPYGYTALMVASSDGRMDMARLLVNRGAGLDFRDAAGMTALDLAAAKGRVDMARFLRESGAAAEGTLLVWTRSETVDIGTMGFPQFKVYAERIIAVSPDGRTVAAPVDDGTGEVRVWINGKPSGGTYDSIREGSLAFSADGRSLAYAASLDGRWTVVRDGVEDGYYGEILEGTPLFLPGGRLMYGAKKNGSWRVVSGDTRTDGYEDLGTISSSPDGKRIAYSAKWRGDWYVFLDGERGRAYGAIGRSLVFSPDSSRLAYVAVKGKKRVVVVDGKEQKEFDEIGTPVFSPDSGRLAYPAKRGQSRTVVVDGSVTAWYEIVGESISFSADGGRIGYYAGRDGKWFAVVDGKEGKPYDAILRNSPVFSPDGARVAYAARIGAENSEATWRVIVNDREIATCRGIGTDLVFSPDGRHLVHGAFLEDDKWCVVVDGKKRSVPYSDVRLVDRDCIRFNSPDSFGYHFVKINRFTGEVSFHYNEVVLIE